MPTTSQFHQLRDRAKASARFAYGGPQEPSSGPASPPYAVELVDAGMCYGSVEATAGVNLAIEAGEFVCIVGASGCGKSTLLRMVAGFARATSGSILVDGNEVKGPGPDRGVVFQDYGLFPWLSVGDNIGYGPRRRGVPRPEVASIVAKHCAAVGLTDFADRYPHELSGGMQQRVAIARVLANESPVLLMDEPFGALDALTRTAMQAELHQIWRDVKRTVLFVTHSAEEAVFLADRVVVMSGGPSSGTPGHLSRIVNVDLAHPRDTSSLAFNAKKRDVLDAIMTTP